MKWRNRRYDRRAALTKRVPVPVISVGNITLGGTGKTPMVEWLARWFRERGTRVAIVSRGYGAARGERGDEALELEDRLPDVPGVQNPDRVAAAELAIHEFESQLILLDDAFQHRRIARDLDVVMLDAMRPFGFDHVFPRGMLREPLSGLSRADAVILSRADGVPPDERARIRRTVARYAPRAAWVEVSHRPACLLSADGAREPLAALTRKRVAAFCGIGNPSGFRHTLANLGCDLVDFRALPDHHAYRREDVTELSSWAARSGAELVLCTHKDLVKVGLERLGDKRLLAVVIGIEFLAGREALEELLARVHERIAPSDDD